MTGSIKLLSVRTERNYNKQKNKMLTYVSQPILLTFTVSSYLRNNTFPCERLSQYSFTCRVHGVLGTLKKDCRKHTQKRKSHRKLVCLSKDKDWICFKRCLYHTKIQNQNTKIRILYLCQIFGQTCLSKQNRAGSAEVGIYTIWYSSAVSKHINML